jgi:ABC-2 type transport system permease protein
VQESGEDAVGDLADQVDELAEQARG